MKKILFLSLMALTSTALAAGGTSKSNTSATTAHPDSTINSPSTGGTNSFGSGADQLGGTTGAGTTAVDTLGTDENSGNTRMNTTTDGTVSSGGMVDESVTGTTSTGTSGAATGTNDTSTTSSGVSAGTAPTDIDTQSISESEVLTFKKGQSKLTTEHKNKLRSMLSAYKGTDMIEHVKVAAWSDKEFSRDAKFTSKDRNLAMARAKAVESFIKSELTDATVGRFNMADRTNWLARKFNISDTELQSEFAKADAELKQDEFQAFKDQGAASSVVIVLAKSDIQSQFETPETTTPGTTTTTTD